MTIPIAILLLIIAVFVWAALRGWLRGSVHTHDERAREALKATRDSLDAGQVESPSWASDPNKIHEFTYGVRKLLDRAAVNVETRKTLFAEEGIQETLMTHAAHMERKGASFIQQQLGAGEFATQLARALEQRIANGDPIDLAPEKVTARKEAELDEALRIPIQTFLEMYDQLEGRRRDHYAAAVHILHEGVIDVFGSVDGFIESSDELQLRFVAKLKPTDEDAGRYTDDVAFVYKLSRQFVSAVLLLLREEREAFLDVATPQSSPTLAYGIRRLVEIAEEGKAVL